MADPFNLGAPGVNGLPQGNMGNIYNGKNGPARPDYIGAANQQADLSKQAVGQQTQANRPNQTNAFGSGVQWTQNPDGSWGQSQSFGGPMGGAANALQGQLGQSMSTPFDMGQFTPAMNGDQARDQAINSAYGQATSRLDPQWQQRQEQIQTQLANQGLDPNSEAAKNAMQQFSQQRNDAYSSAMNGAVAQGTAAGDSVFRNNQMARQQAIADALRQRQLPMQELQQLSGFLAQPGFTNASAADPAQLLPATMAGGQYDFNMWNQTNQNQADLWGGMGQAAGGLLNGLFMLSDERAKIFVHRLKAEAMPGVPFATWQYREGYGPAGSHCGVIAQDLQRVAPEFVRTRPDGLLEVDYSFLFEVNHG